MNKHDLRPNGCENYFNIRYLFDPVKVDCAIQDRLKLPGSDYICVADGVILDNVNRNEDYQAVVNGGMFSICDSSYVPLYIRLIYGRRRNQYCGSDIFRHIVSQRRYRMVFLGTSESVLQPLQKNLAMLNPDVAEMTFVELPFCRVEDFDYVNIAKMIEKDGADIVWVALGAPKQEQFMSKLKPYLNHGVMIAVGAAFKFFSGIEEKRAPQWMVEHHLEFVFRIFSEPSKQFSRCLGIVTSLPRIFKEEFKRRNNNK